MFAVGEADTVMSGNGKGKLFVVSGPSGSGKSTLCREAIKRTNVKVSVSATTRGQGKNEVDGRDYYFLSRAEFEAKIAADEFLEYAEVFGNYYGTPAEPVKEMLGQGQTVILEIDVQGATQVFEKFGAAMGILVLAPSAEEIKKRLAGRGRDDEETIQKRLAKALWEIEQAKNNKHYRYTIVNDDVERAIDEMVTIFNK